ncbi:tyrosine-protein phosphatase [Rubrolithibacter danxiaensis]|uniref:tyrosine-protein phosphatase n=1 Tax=Rubrolithibacter danxiaensis TaxID=3390805 RepID=UPI003BF85186
MLFNLFKKKSQEPGINFSSIKVDLHSHLIPGIDDGSPSVEHSVDLVSKMMELGFKKLITTPHVMADYYRNTPEIIKTGLDNLREELAKRNIEIQLEAAAEYYLDETFDNKLESGQVLTLGKGFLLFELSFVNCPQSFYDTIEKIKDKGYKPVLAHPERYPYFANSIENYQKIKATGCYLQLNTLSLTGYYGKPTQKIAEELVDKYLIDFLGSDLHHHKHAAMLKQALSLPYVKKVLTEYQLQNELLF